VRRTRHGEIVPGPHQPVAGRFSGGTERPYSNRVVSSEPSVSVPGLESLQMFIFSFGLEKLAGLVIRTALRRTVIECAFTGTAW